MSKIFKRVTAVLMAVIFCLIAVGCSKTDDTSGDETTTKEQEKKVASTNPLTGASDLDPAKIGKRAVAIVVENSPAARPQWGLGSPDITIEGLVEGGITRMLWVYADSAKVPKVGPTRSARIDFLEMAEGLDAIFVHFGGAESAYKALRARGYDDIDGAGAGNLRGTAQYFKRDTSRNNRGTEHTAYTTGEWLTNALTETGVRTDIKSGYEAPFKFSTGKQTLSGGACTELGLTFSSSYKHTFKYDASKGVYLNFMNSNEMVDENNNQMAVTNVILLYFPSYSNIPNTKGSIDMDLSGGTGVVASNGTYQEIKWTKGGPNDMLSLKTTDGKDFSLNIGKSYIALIPAANASSTVIK